jgi:hypothetical protein
VCNNLYQYGIDFTDTTTHTSDIAGDEFAADLDRFARVCRTVKGLKNARIGSIGARTGAFQTVRYSEKILQASGVTVVTVDLSEILGAAQRSTTKRRRSKRSLRRSPLRPHPGAHQAREHRQAGQALARRQSLDRKERMRRQRHPVLDQRAGQLRLRHLPVDEHDERTADAERLRSRRRRRGLDVRAGAGFRRAARPARLEQQLRQASRTSASARTAATSRRASSASSRKFPTSTCSARRSGRRSVSARSRARSRPDPMTYFRISTDDLAGQGERLLGKAVSPPIRSPWTAASR